MSVRKPLTLILLACAFATVILTCAVLSTMVRITRTTTIRFETVDMRLIDVIRADGSGKEAGALLESAPQLVAVDIGSGETALHEAARYGNTEIIEVLLSHGADIGARTADAELDGSARWTALHYAVTRNRLPAARLLLERGADPDAPDQRGDTPRDLARMHVLPEMTGLLAQYPKTRPAGR